MKNATTSELEPGHDFRILGKLKFYTVAAIHEITTGPEDLRGKMLIVTLKCKQIILSKDREIIIYNR